MKSNGKSLAFCLSLVAGYATGSLHADSAYTPAPFAHYQPILDRMPFGALPPSYNPNAASEAEEQRTAEQEKLEQKQIASKIGFSALNITPKGTIAVGFTDRAATPPENHYLQVGESANGWKVLKANYRENWAKFEKDGVVITMHLSKGMIDDPDDSAKDATNAVSGALAVTAAPVASVKPAVAAHVSPVASIPGLVRRSGVSSASTNVVTSVTGSNGKVTARSFAERLRERTAKEEAQKAAVDKATIENLQKLARQVAQDELAKRDEEATRGVEELRLQQALFAAQQEEAAAREVAEAAAEAAAAEAELQQLELEAKHAEEEQNPQ